MLGRRKGAYRRLLLDLVEGKYADAIALAGKGTGQTPQPGMVKVYLALAVQYLGVTT